MENGTTTAVMQPGRLIVRSTRERRTPEHEARFQRILAVRAADPERFKRKKEEPPIRFDLSKVIKQHGPGVLVTNRPEPLCYAPFFLTDLYEASCATKSEAKMYKKLVNDDPVNYVLSVVNRKTGLVDEEFTARMIKRYREDPVAVSEANMYKQPLNPPNSVLYKTDPADEEFTERKILEVPGKSSVTAVSASDEVQKGISVLDLNRYELGESNGTVVTTSVNNQISAGELKKSCSAALKMKRRVTTVPMCHGMLLGESSESVIPAFRNG